MATVKNRRDIILQSAAQRIIAAPSASIVPLSISVTEGFNGTRNVQITWSAYTQGAIPASYIYIGWTADKFIMPAAPTTNSAQGFIQLPVTATEYTFDSVDQSTNYRIGIVVSQIINGKEYFGTVVSPTSNPDWRVAKVTPVINATNVTGLAESLSDLNNDGKLTPNEKIELRRKFNEVLAERSQISSQATDFGVTTELNSYNSTFQSLADYLNNGASWTSGDPYWLNSTNISVTHNVVGLTLDSLINSFILARTALLQKLTDIAKTKAVWTGVSNRPNNLADLNSTDGAKLTGIQAEATKGSPVGTLIGNTLAETVESRSASAFTQAAAMIDDNVLSPGTEKAFWRSGWDSLLAQNPGLVSQASALGVSSSAYSTAFINLANYLHGGTWNAGTPAIISDAQLGTATSVNGATGRALLATLQGAITDLQNAMDAKAATISTWAGTTSKPSNIGALTGAEAIQNSQIGISSGLITGIGTGNNTPVSNSLITVDDNGNIINIGNSSSVSVGNNINGLIRNPGGGTYVTASSNVSGALVITLPVFFTNTMLKFIVDIFEYSAGLSCTLSIAGYNSSDNNWYNTTAVVIGSSNVEYPVFFGHNGTKAVIWIGNVNETWTYPQVQVRDVMISFTNYSKGMWESGWVISFSSATRTNVTASVLDTYPGADWTKNSKRPSNLAALAGTELIKNSDITIDANGQITNIGTTGVVVDNSKVTLSALGYTGSLAATKNTVTQSSSNPSGGSAGDLHYNTATKRWWTNIGGVWTDNQIEAVSVTAAWVTALTINANQINAGTFTSHTIDTSGYGRFRGAVSVDGYQAALIANDQSTQYTGIYSKGSTHGLIGSSAASFGSGVYGTNTGSGIGVSGFSTNGYGGVFTSTQTHGVAASSTYGYGGSFSSSSSRGITVTSNGNHGTYSVTTASGFSGVVGEGTSGNGVYGSATSGNGVYGNSSSGTALVGISSSGRGVSASSVSSYGVYGYSANSYGGVFESTSGYGLYASSSSGNAFFCNGALVASGTIYTTGSLSCSGLSCSSLTVSSNTMVSNLNANFLNGKGALGYVNFIYGDIGGGPITNGSLSMNCTVSGYQFSQSSNSITLQPVSDSRLKEDIWPEIFGKEFIRAQKPVSYRYKSDPTIRHHGFLANDMVEFTGDFNDGLSLYDKKRDIYGTDYMSRIGPLTKALQEAFDEIDELRKEMADLKTLILSKS